MKKAPETPPKPPSANPARQAPVENNPEASTQQTSGSRWKWKQFPLGGWVYWQAEYRMQRVDQGQDFEMRPGRHIIAPGYGKCIRHLSDGPWPGGFGTPYAVVWIGNGRFGGKYWYLGHDNEDVVPVGHVFHSGDILAKPNHSLNAGWVWSEIGHAPNGYPGPMGEGANYHSLFSPVWKWTTY